MITIYKLNEGLEPVRYSIDDAIEATEYTDVFGNENPVKRENCYLLQAGDMVLGVVTDANHDKYMVYSFDDDSFITDYPLSGVEVLNDYDAVMVSKRYGKNNYYNIFTKDGGLIFDTFYPDISKNHDKNGNFVVQTENGTCLMNINGERITDESDDDMYFINDCLVVDNGMYKTVYDEDGNVMIDDIDEIEMVEYEYYKDDDSSKKVISIFVKVYSDDGYSIYYPDFTPVVENLKDIDTVSSDKDIYYIKSNDDEFNIIGRSDKLVFDNDSWFDKFEVTPYYIIVTKGNKKNLVNARTLVPFSKTWYDDISFIDSMNYNIEPITKYDQLAIMRIGNKYNLLIVDRDNNYHGKFLLADPADDIQMDTESADTDLLIIRYGDDEYILNSNWQLDDYEDFMKKRKTAD